MKRSLILLGAGILVIAGILLFPTLQSVLTSYPDTDPSTEYTPISDAEQSAIILTPDPNSTEGDLYISFTSNLSECSVRDPHSDYEVRSTFTPTRDEFVTVPDTEVVITCVSSAEETTGDEYLVMYKEYQDETSEYTYTEYFEG